MALRRTTVSLTVTSIRITDLGEQVLREVICHKGGGSNRWISGGRGEWKSGRHRVHEKMAVDMEWIHLAEGSVHCLAVLNVVTLGSM